MGRRSLADASCGLVQIIHLYWNKSARGGQGARDRNSVPLALEVPEEHLRGVGGQIQVEELRWDHHNAFAEPTRSSHQRFSVEQGFKYGCVSVSCHSQGLRVRFQWGGAHCGAPARWYINAPRADGATSHDMIVRAGGWVRVRYNGRFTGHSGNWWYEQVTVNVAWFDGEPSGHLFMTSDPAREFKLLAELW